MYRFPNGAIVVVPRPGPYVEGGKVWVFARKIKGDPTSARYVCLGLV
jgi:hypothetical protein